MEILSRLSPAETYLIIKHKDASLKELLKYTLLDLLFKKVLKTEEQKVTSGRNDKVVSTQLILAGAKFPGFQAKPFEMPFLETFLKSPDLVIPFGQMIKISIQKVRHLTYMVFNLMSKNPEIQESFERGFFKRWIGLLKLTPYGVQLKAEVDAVLLKLDQELPPMIESNPERAREILQKIGGNMFLIYSMNADLLKKIDDEFGKGISQTQSDTSYGCSGCYMYMSGYSDSFDDGYDSSDSSSDGGGSGCSGDSGCSGCGGCGGD